MTWAAACICDDPTFLLFLAPLGEGANTGGTYASFCFLYSANQGPAHCWGLASSSDAMKLNSRGPGSSWWPATSWDVGCHVTQQTRVYTVFV